MHERKIPTIVGLLLVGLAVMIFRFAFDRVSPLLTKASANLTPQHVTLSNVSDTSFTVSWITAERTSGALLIDGMKTPIYDDRFSSPAGSNNTNQTFLTHMITVRNLKPETTYHMRLLSGGKPFLNNGNPFEIRTASALSGTGTNLEPAYGQITSQNGNPAEGALVYLSFEGGQLLSTMVNASGSWVIPLNLVRSQDLTAYMTVSERMDESITIRSSEGEASALTDNFNDNPVPAMTIGKTYDFRKLQAQQQQQQQNRPLASASPSVLGSDTVITNPNVAIVKPAQGAAIPSDLPLIQGTGVPGNTVLVILGLTNPTSTTVTVGPDGIWRYTPHQPLAAGKQSVTITTNDQRGKTTALTHTFEVLKSGTQVLGDATPSATLAPTPTLDTSPTPTTTLSGEPMPTSGNEMPLLILLLLGSMLIIGGTSLLIL